VAGTIFIQALYITRLKNQKFEDKTCIFSRNTLAKKLETASLKIDVFAGYPSGTMHASFMAFCCWQNQVF
jgi:hypothetical protein